MKSNLNNISHLVEEVRSSLDIVIDIDKLQELNQTCNEIQRLIMKEQDKIETGEATVMVDEDTGDKYWEIYDEGDHDSTDMNIGEYLQFNPEAFEEGTVIRIREGS